MSVPMELNADTSKLPKNEDKVLVLTPMGHWFVVQYAPDINRWVGDDGGRPYGTLREKEIVLWSPVPQDARLSNVSSQFDHYP